jgi:hypothetical protein
MTDPPAKARHCVLMMLAAVALADSVPEEIHKRALARYSFLYADAGLEWMRKWRNRLKRDPPTANMAQAAKPAVDRLAAALDEAGDVRDYLAAKRQAVADLRADDLEATTLLWLAINPEAVGEIVVAAVEAFDTLDSAPSGASIRQLVGIPEDLVRLIDAAYERRDPSHWYAAADTSADLRRFTLQIAQGGPIGRRVAQINDVAANLDALLPLAPIVEDVLIPNWLVRSAIALELNGLLDLALGPPPGGSINVMYPLLDLCRADGSPDMSIAAEDLEGLAASIGASGWRYIRWLRNSIGAHVDSDLSIIDVHEHLLELDYQGIVNVAVGVLNFLDELGANRLGLKLLVLGERRIKSWPIDPSIRAPGRPSRPVQPASLASVFRRFDSPYMIISASNLGSGLVAGMTAGRRPSPRPPTEVKGRPPNRYTEGLLPYHRLVRL